MFKFRNLFWLAVLIGGYNYIFDDEPEKLEKLKKEVAPIVEKAKEEVKNQVGEWKTSKDWTHSAKKEYPGKKDDESIGNPVDVSVFGGKDENPKDEKLIAEPKEDESKKLEKLEGSPNKVKEKRPMFKSLD